MRMNKNKILKGSLRDAQLRTRDSRNLYATIQRQAEERRLRNEATRKKKVD